MKQSHLFTKTRKEAPKDEMAKNAELLIRAGYIHKEMAGVYSFLPLGLRVFKKVQKMLRSEMDTYAEEIFLTTLQSKDVWEVSGRWSDKVVDNWFKTSLKNEAPLGLGFTHEEPLTAIMREHIRSFRDLPRAVYQLQTKFRNEERAKSGLLRGREFMMKDLYSFCQTEEEHNIFYERMKTAYRNVFNAVGIGEKTFLTYAAGGTFSKYSHEFQTITPAGEDTIYICEKCNVAVNEEIHDEVTACPECGAQKLVKERSVEVGNIFSLGTRFSDAFDLTYTDLTGERKKVFMGSYGIGVNRLMGTVVEVLADEKGIVWPKILSPFAVHLVLLSSDNLEVKKYADELYTTLSERGVEVLYDDRDLRPGEKFAESDLLGISTRAIVSEKTLAQGGIEVKERHSGKTSHLSEKDFYAQFE